VKDLNNQPELDLSVFKLEFDIHHRGKQCLREIRGLRENRHPSTGKQISPANQGKLLDYADWMIHRIKREEFSVSSFEKNLSEAWKFCLFLGKLPAEKLEETRLNEWWEQELKRYEEKKIKYWTLCKELECCRSFLKWVNGLNGGQRLPLMESLILPKRPKLTLFTRMPSQEEVKQLIDAVYASDKYSLRNQAVMALANDTGARISEILSMRNKHIKPEKNYLVVSFPESKTAPRTVISFLAKPYLEKWAKVSPNKNAGPEAFFFCQCNGEPITYATIRKAFHRAMDRVQIPWKKKQAVHFFRSIFSSRAFDWPYALKHYWMGWAFSDHEKAYTHLGYQQCVEQYFSMLKKENNPMIGEEAAFWSEKDTSDKVIQKLLEDKPEFKAMLRQLVRETMHA
jgi:site-specific recombinase XerC